VPSGGARRGRRDNGLQAADFVAVGDVDPRVGEHLLDVLALNGIAAYLQPAADLNPVTRSSIVPARPTDRLFADRAHLGVAREYLAKLRADEERERRPGTDRVEPAGAAPAALEQPADGESAGTDRPGRPGTEHEHGPRDPDPVDLDAAWARIVAGFDSDVAPEATPWPAAEDVTERRAGAGDRRPAPQPPVGEEPSLLDALDTFGADLPDDEEGYTPPPPPPLPRLSRATVLSLVSIALGLAVFFSPGLLPVDGNLALLLGFSAVLAGFVGLIWRLRPGDEEDSDPDNGAVV
jgi:hypothetical protein